MARRDEGDGLELRRKLFHSCFGLFLIFVLFNSGRKTLIILLSLLLLCGSIIIIWRLQGNQISIIKWFEKTFERKNAKFPGYGAFWFVFGTLLLALSLSHSNEIAAGILILALGDSAATIFGIRGNYPLPYNRCKTIEGSVAFFIFSLTSCPLVGWMGFPLAFLTSVVESLPVPFDDNLLIPIAAALFFTLYGIL
jgi:dolichol kinase